MTIKVKIYGAGSIGNHYANSYINNGCAVTIYDIDIKALQRTKNFIYPNRYGKWNKKIKLINKDDENFYDIIIIGTPPDSHLKIAKKIFKHNLCKILHIEKPLCVPNFKEINFFKKINRYSKIKLICGYNLIFTKWMKKTKKILAKKKLGKIISISVYNMEHWGGIFNAHPWLKGPEESYLGFTKRGGGSLCEHSHGLNLSIHLINFLSLGKIKRIRSENYFKKNKITNYDFLNYINFETSKKTVCHIVQDVISNPPSKKVFIQCKKGSIEILQSVNGKFDEIKIFKKKLKIIRYKKNRKDDFKGQTKFVLNELKNKSNTKCKKIFEESINTMKIINKSLKSKIYV